MATCTNCYGTNTVQPCDSVGCLSTNYGKCITYSGSNLFCQSGSIATFTFTGTAVAPTTDTSVVASATGGNGTDATFTVIRRAGTTVYEVTLSNIGANYEVSDILTIPGTSVGGTSPANDITITVATLSAVIANGDNLDTIISNLNNRLCLVASTSPRGLDYTSFNYGCLRVGGNLEGVGTAITTAKDFTEAVAAALCSINTRLKGVELPPIIVDSYFGGTLVSGTSTLTEILNEYGGSIGDLDAKFTVNSPTTCGIFTNLTSITTKPSSTASLGTWFDWVSTNLCTIYGEIDATLSTIASQFTYTNLTLWGTNTPYPSPGGITFIDTSCLPGGLANDRVMSALQLVTDELCSLKTVVGSGGSTNYTVNWNCFTTYGSGSLFNIQGLPAFLNTTTLQGHLNQIASALSDLNITFDSSDFTVTSGPCGPTIQLASGSTFSCASLSSCVLSNLGDVFVNALSQNQILIRDSSNTTWFNVDQTIKIGTPNGGNLGTSYQYKDFAYDGVTGDFTSSINLPIVDAGLLLQSTLLPSAFTLTHAILYSQLPQLRVNKSSGRIEPEIAPGFLLQNVSGIPYTIANNVTLDIFEYSNTKFHAGSELHIPVSVIEKTGATAFSAVRHMALRVNANSVNNQVLGLTNISGDDITIPAGFYLEVYFGGVSWPMVL